VVTLCKIDGKSYDDIVTAIQETYTVVEGSNKGTALHKQREIRDILGVKVGHSVSFAPKEESPELFDELVRYLFGTPRESVRVEVVHNQKTLTYEAAYSTGTRAVNHIDNENDVVYWGEITIEFRPMEIQTE
jgi:hypothetical protein